jgi:hypothetical protein
MPGGDHLNLIDPPGLTVMKIAGGRYRVTAAHKVVWTWMNEFASLSASSNSNDSSTKKDLYGDYHKLQMGDLVCMTIIDVFETDNQVRSSCFARASTSRIPRTMFSVVFQFTVSLNLFPPPLLITAGETIVLLPNV